MAHAWDSNILGGTDVPRIFIGSDNMCTNPYMNEGLITGWSKGAGASGTLSAVIDNESYGNYVLKFTGASSTINDIFDFSVDFNALFGGNINGKTIIAFFRIKTNLSCTMMITDGTNLELKRIHISTANTIMTKIGIIADTISVSSDTVVKFRVYVYKIGGPTYGLPFTITLDNLYFVNVTDDIELKQPQQSGLVFKENVSGENILWNGLKQRFNRKWIPEYSAFWGILTSGEEYELQRIYSASSFFILPHKDVMWGFLGQWDKDFDRNYFFDRYIGHEKSIKIIGGEFIKSLPFTQPIGASLQY